MGRARLSRRGEFGELIAATGELTVVRDRERPSGRLLRLGGMDASYVDLADPGHLEFDYLRWLRALVRAAGAERVVHVGGAGCALARALAAEHPDHRQEVIERDAEVVAIAREHLGLRRAPGLKVRVGDGRETLAGRADGSADAVLIDAFEGALVPRHLVTAEALADLARIAGLAAVNVVDDRAMGDAAAIAAGLQAAFAHVLVLGPAPALARRRSGNVIVAGSHAPLPLDRLCAALAADRAPAALLDPAEAATFMGGAPPWFDG